MNRFRNKLVLITGASSGIGSETAIRFAGVGAEMILVARNKSNLLSVSHTINESGGKSHVFPLDVTDNSAVVKAANIIKKEIGVPDVIFNNAGSGVWKFVEETEYEEAVEMIKAPYLAAFSVTKAFLPEMLKRNSGNIVNMTSYPGFMPFAGGTTYVAARAAMIGFTNALRADFYHTKLKSSIAYFAKVQSSYWKNNPGSEERIPKAQVLIPVISEEQAAKIIVNGVAKGKRKIRGPFMLKVVEFLTYLAPFITRFIMDKTGYKKDPNKKAHSGE